MEGGDIDYSRLLAALREEAEDVLPSKGFGSREFQTWHEKVMHLLRVIFPAGGGVVNDFQQLRFEWNPEAISSFERQITESGRRLEDESGAALAEPASELWRQLNSEKKKAVLETIRSFGSVEFSFATLQRQKFLSDLTAAKEILSAASISLHW